MGRLNRRRSTAWAAVVLLLAAGCGTTVRTTNGGRASPSDQGLSAQGSTPQGRGSGSVTGSQPGASPLGQGVPANAEPNGVAPVGSEGASVASGAATAPRSPSSRPSTVVRMGVVYLKSLAAAYKAAGAKSATTDSQADYAAVVADINAHGGIAGRRLEATYFAIDSSSTTDPATQDKSACTFFAQDHPVDIVVSYSPGLGDVLATCLHGYGIPLVVGANESDVSASTLTSDATLWEPAEVSLDRLERELPGSLAAQHWVDARWGSKPGCTAFGPRIGVITFDQPDWHYAYSHDLAPAFQAVGHQVYDVAFLSVSGNSASQLADASAAVQSAVLRFSSDCVDHVVFVSNVAVDYLFMNVAEQQHYNPRYGLSSLEAPPVIIQNLANPASQLQGTIGVGWSPFSDVDMQDFDATARAPAQRCLQVLQRAGLAPVDNNSAILAVPSCEGPYFAAAAVDRWLASPSGATLTDTVNGLASTYQPTGTFSARFDPTEHDGASSYRIIGFVDSCDCFRYTSGLRQW